MRATIDALEYNGEWLSERYVTVTVESPEPIAFAIGDYLEYRGERFEINYDPGKIKSAPRFAKGDAFKYENIKFNSLADELARCDFLDVVLQDNQLHFTGLPKFSFYGGVRELAARIQANLNRAYPGKWTVIVDEGFTDSKELNVSVDTKKVWGALSILVDEFKTYFTIKGRTITIGAAGVPAGHLFKYGIGNGLYEIEQTAESDQAIVTRLRAYGSTRNLPHRYYNSLSGADGTKLIPDNMAVPYLMLPAFPYSTQDPYIDSANISTLGIREGTIFFDGTQEGLEEIYPSIKGMTAEQLKAANVPCNSTGELDVLVSASQIADNGIGEVNEAGTSEEITPATFKVTIKDLGFDINDHKIAGNSNAPTVSFKSGKLAGREFEIVGCVALKDASGAVTGYELELNRVFVDDVKLWFPYSSYNATAGDKFVLLYIKMPEVYIKAAAQRLKEAAEAWLAKNDYSRSVYAPKVDEIFMARQHDAAMASNGAMASLHDTLREGMLLLFEDEDLNIDASVFIDRLTIKEGNEAVPTYEVVLKEEKTAGRLDKMQNKIDSLASGAGQGTGGYTAAQIRGLIDAYGGTRFLSKIKNDTTPYDLTVGGQLNAQSGATFGTFSQGRSGSRIASSGDAEVGGLVVRGRADFGDWMPGERGASVWTDAEGTSHIEGDVFHVRRKLTAREVEIQKERHVGGAVILSPASGVLTRVEYLKATTSRPAAWRCYFAGSDAQGRVVYNEFVPGDLVRCKTFALERQEDGTVGNRYWWRQCAATGTKHYVYDEKTGTRLENLCSEPRPAGVSVTADGNFRHADGSYTPLDEVPAAGEVVTLRIRGRFAKAQSGDKWAITRVFVGVWVKGFDFPGVQGGVDNEVAEVTFAWPANATEKRVVIQSFRTLADNTIAADSDTKLSQVELVRGRSISGEERTEHWIDVSTTDCDTSVENSAPREGDEVHTVGSKTDPTRGNVVMLSAYDAGAGEAPCLVCYEKLDDYSFPAEKMTARLSPSGNYVRGEFKVKVGDTYQDVKDWAKNMAEGYTNSQFNVLAERINSSVTEVKAYTDNQVQGASDLLSSGLNTVQGNVVALRQYVDVEYYDALTDIFDGLENGIGAVSYRTSTLEQTAEAITGRVVSVEADAAGLKQSVGELEVRSDRITAQLTTTREAVPNLCTTPFVDAMCSDADGHFYTATAPRFTLTEPVAGGTEITVRLRGKFYPGGFIQVWIGSWNRTGITLTSEKTITGIDNEEVICHGTVPGGDDAGLMLEIRSRAYIGGQWHQDGSCYLKYIAVVRGGVMPQAYREEDALGDALLPTGIDIRERKVKITADNFEVENNSGERTMLVDENGRITAKLIDADNITARRVVAGTEGGERVEINPAEKSVAVYDPQGKQCTVLDGTEYTSGPASLGAFGAYDTMDIGPLAGGRWTSVNKVLPTRSYTSGDFQCAAGTVRVSGTIVVRATLAERAASEKDESGLSVNVASEYAEVTATLTLTVGSQSYALGEATLKLQHNGLVSGSDSYPAQSRANTLKLGSKTVNVTAAGTARLTLTLKNTSNCKTGKYTTTAEWTLSAGRMEERYISRYFANGLILGSSTSRYFAAWHGADGYMNFETRNDATGLRLTKNGAYMLGPEGSWHPLYSPLGFFYVEPVAGSAVVNVRMSGGGNLPAPTAVSSGGTITLTFPQAWADAGLSIQQVWPRITPTKAGSTIAMTGQTADTMSFATTDSGVATPVRFFMELVLTHN